MPRKARLDCFIEIGKDEIVTDSSFQSNVIDQVRKFVESNFAGKYDVYDVVFRSGKRRCTLEVKIDSPTGVMVSDCEAVSRALSKHLDEVDVIHLPYNLEVSSPGAERRLLRAVDYERQVGRLIRWVLKPQQEGPKEVFQARLQEFNPPIVRVSTDKELREFPLSRVDEARVVLEFPRKKKD